MQITPAQSSDRESWNIFIRNNYPPVGVFMQTWEWGEFKKDWGKKIERFFVTDGDQLIAAFMLAEHSLPFGFSYGYLPRGPVLAKTLDQQKINAVFSFIRDWAVQKYRHLIFLRLEPPVQEEVVAKLEKKHFFRPDYYIQPKYNLTLDLTKPEEEILASFHSSTRSNLNRAERRGVTVTLKNHRQDINQSDFWQMTKDTISRNSGKNLYPPRTYFDSMFKILPALEDETSPDQLSIGTFCGYQHDKPAATHYVLFFGDTATYIYGASATECLKSKVTTYLHWQAAREAKTRGFKYYDLGGIDEKLWPSITTFKRQFGGLEFTYVGLIDIPLQPRLYKLYNFLKKLRHLRKS